MGPVKRLALLSTLAALVAPATAAAAETTVDAAASGCTRGVSCPTIAGAVGVSQADDTITVKAGGYTENVTIPADKTGLVINAAAGAALSGGLVVNAPSVKINRLTVARTEGGDPAITAAGGGFELRDAVVVSTGGAAVVVSAGAGNLVQRSTLVSTGAAGEADGLRLQSTNAGARALQVDSSILAGGATGAAVRVLTSGLAGDAAITLNHATAVSAAGLVLDGSGSTGTILVPAGDITANVNSSIVHGASSASNNGLPIGNTVTVAYSKSDADVIAPGTGVTVTQGETTRTSDSALFGKNFRLKLGSPAIDKGGAVGGGESGTDVDGEPRVTGPAPDIGADEYLNVKPTVSLTVEPSPVRKGAEATFTAKGSDGNGSGDIAGYGFDFGDGTPPQRTTSNSVTHTYAKEGTYVAQVAAADKSGAISDVAKQTVVVGDGSAPNVKVDSPAYARKVTLGRKKLKVSGTASDESGVEKVDIALTRILTNGCSHYTGSGFTKADCAKYRFRKAKLSGNSFSYATKKGLKLKPGIYEIRARGTDKKGNFSTVFSKVNNLVRFRIQ